MANPTSNVKERQPQVSAAYDNRRNSGVSLSNPCSTAASQELGAVQTYVRQEVCDDQEGKHEPSRLYRVASLTRLQQFFGMALPSKVRTMADCEQYPTHLA